MLQPFDRRTFLKATLAGGLYGLTKPHNGVAAEPARPSDWIEATRAEIPALQEGAYFQTAAFGPSPRRVIDRTKTLLDIQNLNPAHPDIMGQLKDEETACRQLVAETFGAKTTEVALTANTTGGLNTVLWSIDWKSGDEIIIGDQEHPALLIPVHNLQRRFGVIMKMAPVGRHEVVVAEVIQRLSPRTRLVAMSHVSRSSGSVLPAAALAAALRGHGSVKVVRGVMKR